jgi:NAD(P)-dependent dehydrogenase (short-subunit alcohol dehydrogenase family)
MDREQVRLYQGATAIITGGASGIGRSLGEALARRGAQVFLADLQDALAEEVAASIRAAGGKATAILLDVSDYRAVETTVGKVYESTGRLDFIFNNAGIAVAGPPERLS